MKTIADPAILAALSSRLQSVAPATERRWGSMTSQQMLAHLGDGVDAVLQRRPWPTSRRSSSRFMKWMALSLPLRWPHNIKAGADPASKVLADGEYEATRQRALDTLQELAHAAPAALVSHHPLFGAMSRADWHRWAWLHTDHHLRQFGV